MAENSTNSNINWQDWIQEQGLQDAASTQPQVPNSAGQSMQGQSGSQTSAQVSYTAASSGVAQQDATSGYAQTTNATQQGAQTAQWGTARAQGSYQAPTAYQQASQVPGQAGQQAYNQGALHATTKAEAKAAKRAAKKAAKANKTGKSGGGFKTFALGFLGAACAFAVGSGVLVGSGALAPQQTIIADPDSNTVVLGSETNTAVMATDNHTESLAEAVADKVLPSVVGIDVYSKYANSYSSFWGGGSTDSETLSGLGSGVIISKDGYILTNYHVVEGATKLMVTANGEELEAKVVGTDESSDLAVIKVSAQDLIPVEIGSSDNLRPGQWVMTLGSPFGLEQSVATGIISATSRTVVIQDSSSIYSYSQQVQPSIYSNMIQTDAAINPGNSGGALVDENGKLIGINSVIESYSGSYSGVGFAIPVDYAMNIATQIIDGKTPTHAQLGVSATTVDRDIAERYSLGANAGAYVNKVFDDSGAQEAGLEQGDIIVKVAGVAVESSTDLIGQIRAHNVGETITLSVVRGTETMEVEVTLGSDEETASYLEEQYSNNNNPYGNLGSPNENEGNGYGFGYNYDNGQGQDENGWNFNYDYEDLQDLFDYFTR